MSGSKDTIIDGTPFLVRYRGPRKFDVLEKGTGVCGTARERGRRDTRAAAVELAGTLAPSTIREILEETPVYDERARRDREEIIECAEPGTRLWVLPWYRNEDGYDGPGQAVTATGLRLNAVEALFGGPGDRTWLIGFRCDDGTEGAKGHHVVLPLAQARERWWIMRRENRRWVLVSGGHRDVERMQALRDEKHPGALVVQGSVFMPES